MRIAVVGAGAIGAYVGAALARGGDEVTLIARGPHLRAMQERGVRVLSPRGDFEAHPAATDDLDAVGDAEIVFLALKAYSLHELAPRLGAALAPGAAVIAAQNGIPWWYFQAHGGPLDGTVLESVDPGGTISRSIPPEAVVGCVIYSSTEIVEPGVIRHIEGTRFTVGEPDGAISERCLRVREAFKAGGLKAPVEERLRDEIWLKLVGNAAFTWASREAEMDRPPEVAGALEMIFSADSALYRDRGFMRRVGFGERPALVNIDLANAWTRPGNPFTCDGMDVIIPGVQRLLAAARAKGIPVVFTTTAYAVTEGRNTDMGIWTHKIPVEVLKLGTDAVAIDERIAPEPGEHVVVKKFASAFHGTYLADLLKAAGVDTAIVTG